MKRGPAGRLAAAFIHSPLTPLLILGSLMLGAFSVLMLPREEEPQIKVPMADVFVALPGATAHEVEQRATKPVEKLIWEIPGIEYVYSTSSPGQALIIARFRVGESDEASIVKLNQKLQGNLDRLPAGVAAPLVKLRSIDDVPILALTLHSGRYDAAALRRVAAQLDDAIKEVSDVSAVTLTGGQRRELRVTLDATALAAHGVTALEVQQALAVANRKTPAGRLTRDNREAVLEAGAFLRDAAEAGGVVIQARAGRAVYLRDVAQVRDTGEEPVEYVEHHQRAGARPAVTLAIAKRQGANAITVARQVLERVERERGLTIPAGVELTITRHYGETAAEKSNELLFHMAIAVVSVSLLIALILGWRESWVVFAAVPVTLGLTLTVFYLYGYTLNRITLFALIFSIGILVDDAIVVVENIVRHARLAGNAGRPLAEVAIEAVDEVGNPTILATFTVVAAILPMAFVGGLMGPYMRPIPIGATAAMLFSLLVAFIVTPWAAVRLLRAGHGHEEGDDRLTRLYRRWMHTLLDRRRNTYLFLTGVLLLLVAAGALVPWGFVKVKMLPFDNKSELQVIVDMAEGTPLEETQRVAAQLARAALEQPEVTHAQTYAGTAAPFNFNGLVRHYYLRAGSNIADIQVNLVEKGERRAQSHEIAKQIRTRLLPLARRLGARLKVAEVPPGPPVLQTLVAEIYGPEEERRVQLARQVFDIFERTKGIVDVDWYVEEPQTKYAVEAERAKAALHGISEEAIARTVALAAAGAPGGSLHLEREQESVPITLRLDRASRASLDQLRQLRVAAPGGGAVPLADITRVRAAQTERSLYRKNLRAVTYVTADVAGEIESPVYAVLAAGGAIEKLRPPDGGGYTIEQYVAAQPAAETRYAMKWDGEWHITYEVFRDLGIAFAAVLVLIYILVVGWFESFLTPLVIMAAIPFSLVGILPAHGVLNAFFTATSMIGFIAGAGIVVRNSIILVDFIQLRRQQGIPLLEAVIDAGAVRFRPMLLTAAAVVVGTFVILFDPIFQGLAIALMAGEIASLLLSRMAVPILYFLLEKARES